MSSFDEKHLPTPRAVNGPHGSVVFEYGSTVSILMTSAKALDVAEDLIIAARRGEGHTLDESPCEPCNSKVCQFKYCLWCAS